MTQQKPTHRNLLFWWVVFILLVVISAYFTFKLSNLDHKISSNQPGLYKVTQFDDGDTIEVDMNGTTETIRFIGVDTPETHKPNTPVQCYGPEASVYTKQLIGNQKVRLQADPLNTNRDRYGRLLRYIYLPDGTLVEKKLIEQGYGFAYIYFPLSKAEEFKAYEQTAKKAKLGLWAACQVKVSSDGGQQTNPQ